MTTSETSLLPNADIMITFAVFEDWTKHELSVLVDYIWESLQRCLNKSRDFCKRLIPSPISIKIVTIPLRLMSRLQELDNDFRQKSDNMPNPYQPV
ncbi:MAG TPA: hypothetical protein DDW65_03615 [Firmicutes bacterium]|jgi:hypothetical protein|nr:hypothetical protein [Bacillota bacterium]